MNLHTIPQPPASSTILDRLTRWETTYGQRWNFAYHPDHRYIIETDHEYHCDEWWSAWLGPEDIGHYDFDNHNCNDPRHCE